MRTTFLTALGGCLLLAGCTGSTGAGGSDGAVAPRPAAPAGMQLLGADGVVIAVPASWKQVETVCPPAPVDGAYVVGPEEQPELTEVTAGCAFGGDSPLSNFLEIRPGGPVVTMSLATDPVTSAPALPIDHRSGFEVLYRYACADSTCRATWQLADHDVLFAVAVDAAGGLDVLAAMDASLQVLPAGWTTADDGTVARDQD